MTCKENAYVFSFYSAESEAASILTIDGEEAPLENVVLAPGSERAFVLTTADVETLAASDFSTSSDKVTVALTAAKTITVTVQEDAAIDAPFNVMFRDQVIISGTVAETVITSVNGNTSLPYNCGAIMSGQSDEMTLGWIGPSPNIEDFSAPSAFSCELYGERLAVSASTTIVGQSFVMYKGVPIISINNPE